MGPFKGMMQCQGENFNMTEEIGELFKACGKQLNMKKYKREPSTMGKRAVS